MSKAAQPVEPVGELPFEEALERLERIVESMESGELPLEQLLHRFDEGSRLVRQCQGRLNEADLKIQQLEQALGQEPTLKPIDIEGEAR